MERMSVALSRAWAIMGRCSEMWVPGILVGMGLKSPRMLAGGSGLGAQRSMWLGPPLGKIRIPELALRKPLAPSYLVVAALAVFCHARKLARLRPKRPMDPARRSS